MDKVELQLQDVANALSIIDICVKRGAIEGNELSAVGTVRDKLAKYVEQNKAELDIKAPNEESVPE